MAKKLFQQIAVAVSARQNCKASDNTEWFDKWTEQLEAMNDELPSGSGFDSGSKIDFEASRAERIVINTSFHHMHESGMYDGWTEHQVIVTPSHLGSGFDLKVTGRNRNDIKEYIAEMFHFALQHRYSTIPPTEAEWLARIDTARTAITEALTRAAEVLPKTNNPEYYTRYWIPEAAENLLDSLEYVIRPFTAESK